jgi:hypothetical protein
VKLDRALYGCIESALLWYEAISTFIISLGFRQSDQDECLFILINETENIHLAVYVDDLFISSKNIESINLIELLLKARFKDITTPARVPWGAFGFLSEWIGENDNLNKIKELLKE